MWYRAVRHREHAAHLALGAVIAGMFLDKIADLEIGGHHGGVLQEVR
jgi:hypothetical protein